MSIKKRILSFLLWSLLASVAGITAISAGVFLYISPNLPSVDELTQIELQTPLRVYSNDGKLIGEFGEIRRDPIEFDDIPQPMINAILSAEDDEFYTHKGVDVMGLMRAAYQLVSSSSIKSGGSTITMQVARGYYLNREKTFSRKLTEILLALKIEREITKQEILALYLNQIFLGNNAYGIKAASQVYYGKSIDQLSTAQYAMIAGLPKAPSSKNPLADPVGSKVRRDWILNRMKLLGYIDEAELKNALSQPITATYHGQSLDFKAPYIAEMARDDAFARLGKKVYQDGYEIHTTIDTTLQASAQQALAKGLMDYDRRHGYRGPEKQLKPSTQNTTVSGEPTQAWLDELKKTPTYGPLHPALITSVEEQQVTAINKKGVNITIPWENGIKQANAYIDESRFARAPKKTSDVLAVGDIIRIIKKDDQWHLSQVPKIEGAIASLNPDTGAIIALAGGFNYNRSKFNRASQAKRQPGSNFKPFVYALGLRKGLHPASIFNDAPVVLEDTSLPDDWRPGNSDGKFYGPTRLRKALYLSRNLISIRLLRKIGIEYAARELYRFGIDSKTVPKNLSMVLGTHVMTPLEVAKGYAVFANGGYQVEPFIVKSITNRSGDIIFQHTPQVTAQAKPIALASPLSTKEGTNDDTQSNSGEVLAGKTLETNKASQVLDSGTAFLMSSMLSDVINRGTATRAKSLKRKDIAGKTGTTNGPTDAWFSGYQRTNVTSVWVGFDNNTKIGRREFGGTAALPIWISYMKDALAGTPESPFTPPRGIVRARINSTTGLRTSGGGLWEYFSAGKLPASQSSDTGNSQGTSTVKEIF